MAVGLIAAFITAFYTFRLVFMTFWGNDRTIQRYPSTFMKAPSP